MNWKEFIIQFFNLLSIDVFCGFCLYLLWKYLDLKYFSTFDISTLKRENEYLKQENQKINGSSEFWNDGGIN